MEYIAHNRYKGKTMENKDILIRRGDKLNRVGDILYFKNIPICIYRSLVGKRHFAKNDDGLGMERGDLTYLLAYSNRTKYATDNPEHTQRFTDEEIEKLNMNWYKYLKHDTDMLLFNDEFFDEKPEVLKSIIESIGFNGAQEQ